MKSLAAKPRTVSELPGGLTNRNYKVTTPDGTFVARISSGGSDLLAIDRDCEYRNSVTAAAAGAGPPVVEYRPQDRLLVIGYLEGRTLEPRDVATPGNLSRIAEACRRLHAGGRFGNDFDMFDIQRRYLSVARSRGFKVPAGYDDLAPLCHAAEKALAVRAEGPGFEGPGFEGTVPCHNDLLAANFICDGPSVRLIDWEYAGMGDAFFDLGNFAVNQGLDEAGCRLLLEAYGESDLERLLLMQRVSDMREAFWGFLQAGVSALDFDFRAYGEKHLDRFLERAS